MGNRHVLSGVGDGAQQDFIQDGFQQFVLFGRPIGNFPAASDPLCGSPTRYPRQSSFSPNLSWVNRAAPVAHPVVDRSHGHVVGFRGPDTLESFLGYQEKRNALDPGSFDTRYPSSVGRNLDARSSVTCSISSALSTWADSRNTHHRMDL